MRSEWGTQAEGTSASGWPKKVIAIGWGWRGGNEQYDKTATQVGNMLNLDII